MTILCRIISTCKELKCTTTISYFYSVAYSLLLTICCPFILRVFNISIMLIKNDVVKKIRFFYVILKIFVLFPQRCNANGISWSKENRIKKYTVHAILWKRSKSYTHKYYPLSHFSRNFLLILYDRFSLYYSNILRFSRYCFFRSFHHDYTMQELQTAINIPA